MDIQVQETQSSKKDDPQEAHIKTYCNKIAKVKDRETTSKAARKQQGTYK